MQPSAHERHPVLPDWQRLKSVVWAGADDSEDHPVLLAAAAIAQIYRDRDGRATDPTVDCARPVAEVDAWTRSHGYPLDRVGTAMPPVVNALLQGQCRLAEADVDDSSKAHGPETDPQLQAVSTAWQAVADAFESQRNKLAELL
ncbi:hypothetical protein [Nocardia suismassiliense]|uniref:hypothetical protein n=1 Tax=Nocardia suismassiliense TaxID=2077092 RepID=UPI000D1E6DBE|nr:hypothetical protein [Nocardia suismassiliense]